MDQTNAWFLGHHHTQVVANMHKKFQDILDYAKTKNRKILHIDWIAGNPNDPAKLADAAAAWSGMTEEERRLRETVARMVMKHTHGTEQWDETLTWNKTMFFGDWLNDDRGFRQYFMEIQIKRISGDDPTLLEQCGISSNYVWLPMHDEHAPAITALVCPPANPRPPVLVAPGAPIIPHRQLPDPTQIARAGGPSRQQVIPPPVSDRATTPQPGSPPNETQDQSETQSQPTAQDKGKGKAPRITAAEFAQSLKKRTPLPSLSNFAQRVANWDMSSSSSSSAVAGPSNPPSGTFRPPIAPPPGIPRSPTSTLSADASSETSEDAYHNDETHLTYTTHPVNSFDAVIPAHHAPAQSAADMSRHREEYDRAAYAKRLELDRIFSFLREPTFAARMSKSYIYAVRVVAFPDRGGSINNFTGPSVEARQGSIMALGGWVVPPMEERIKHREENPGAYPAHKAAVPGTYAGPPKPQVQNAMPAQFDWSAGLEPRYFGPVAPVWKEVCEPSLEDIYWLVWQLLSGKQFLGFQPGVGFGKSRLRASGDLELLHQCPFTSPSEESQYQAASYPRGKETK
ncbi:hypothetical protein B0J18DRAFT_373583 [Chaetomium sp. MPI-SDFR-AT-0129]|nr:hypothetical protein B0J18DRAFT_373583 [Chaetomium sp. MPI-SDFR-AT-0129]